MKLLLQAGIHLIKKVITFVIYGRSVQVFKACTLLYFFSAEFFFSQIFLRGKVLSHRFHRYTQIFFIMIFLHRISRRNRRHSCLSDYSRIFAEFWPLANGSRPIYAPVVLVTQISLMTQIFLRGRVLSHRFHRFTQIFYGISGESLCPTSGGICNDRTGRICEICVTKKNRSTQMILPDFILFIWSFHYLIIPLQASIKWYTFKLEYKRKWSSKILSAS